MTTIRVLLISLLSLPLMALANPVADIQEWTVPWPDSRPRDPYVAGPDLIWFVGQKADYAATFVPSGAEFKRYDLPEGAGPHNVIVDKRGAWYAGNRDGHIGLINPQNGDIRRFELPGKGRRDVHTQAFTSQGDIWFTVQQGNKVGFLDTESGEFTLYSVETEAARPYGLVVHQDQPWIVYFASNEVATIKDGKLKVFTLPRKNTLPRRVAVTPDGLVWYVDYAEGYLGRLNPDSGEVKEWQAPAKAQARPYAMSADKKGWLWLVETGVQPNRLVGFNPATETFTDPVPIPSGGGTVRHMVYDPDSHSLWFGTDANTLGQAKLNN